MSDKGKLLFQTTRDVINVDNLMTDRKIDHRVVPVPKRLSAECGMCIEFDLAIEVDLKSWLEEQGLSYRIVYE